MGLEVTGEYNVNRYYLQQTAKELQYDFNYPAKLSSKRVR